MTLTRRARELVIVATLLAVPVLFLRANLAHSDHLNVVDRAILRISAPLQAGLTALARGVGDSWTRYIALVHVKADNARLADENARLRAELVAARSEAAREGELEKLLALRAAVQFDTLAARVVAVETSAFFRVVRIRLDRGGDEVKPGMAVIASAGVVGRVLARVRRLLRRAARRRSEVVDRRRGRAHRRARRRPGHRRHQPLSHAHRVSRAQGRSGRGRSRRHERPRRLLPARSAGRPHRQGRQARLRALPGRRGAAGGRLRQAARRARGRAARSAAGGTDAGSDRAGERAR